MKFVERPILHVFVVVIPLIVAIYLGYFIGRWAAMSVDESVLQHNGAILAAMLAVITLVLSFTIVSSLERHSGRVAAIIDEANCIGTAFLRSDFVQPPTLRDEIQGLLRQYVELRIQMGALPVSRIAPNMLEQTFQIQNELWTCVKQAVEQDSGPISSLFVSSINEMIDSYGRRKAAVSRHIPIRVATFISFVILAGMSVVGINFGLAGILPGITVYLLVAQIGLLAFVTNDLDCPRSGLIRVSHQPFLDLKDSMRLD